ncbi:hypothetical protein GOP47_0014668, partial [Adiantum capillus-veneris]
STYQELLGGLRAANLNIKSLMEFGGTVKCELASVRSEECGLLEEIQGDATH